MPQQIQASVAQKICQNMQIYLIFKFQNFFTVKIKVPFFRQIDFKIAIIYAPINFPFSFGEICTLVMINISLGMEIFIIKVVFLEVRHPVCTVIQM